MLRELCAVRNKTGNKTCKAYTQPIELFLQHAAENKSLTDKEMRPRKWLRAEGKPACVQPEGPAPAPPARKEEAINLSRDQPPYPRSPSLRAQRKLHKLIFASRALAAMAEGQYWFSLGSGSPRWHSEPQPSSTATMDGTDPESHLPRDPARQHRRVPPRTVPQHCLPESSLESPRPLA